MTLLGVDLEKSNERGKTVLVDIADSDELKAAIAESIGDRVFAGPTFSREGIVAYWDFEGSVPMRSKLGFPVVLTQGREATPAAVVSVGAFGHAAQFNGASFLKVAAADAGPLDLSTSGDQFTVIAVYRRRDTNQAIIGGMWDEFLERRQYSLFQGASTFTAGTNGGEGGRAQVSDVGGPTPGYTYNKDQATTIRTFRLNEGFRTVAGVYDGQTLKSYLDGMADSFPTYTEPGPPNGQGTTYAKNPYPFIEGLNRRSARSDFTLGAVNLGWPPIDGYGNFLTGDIAVFAIYNRALSDVEVMRFHLAHLPAGQAIVRLDGHLPATVADAGGAPPADGGYRSWLGTTTTSAETTAAAASNGNMTLRKETGAITYLRRTGAVAANVTSPRAVAAMEIPTGLLRASQAKAIQWIANHDGTTDISRAVIRIGATWYVSDATHQMPVGAVSATDWTKAVLVSIPLDRSANKWRAFDPSANLNAGALVATPIPNGWLTAIGILHENCVTGSRVRYRNLEIV